MPTVLDRRARNTASQRSRRACLSYGDRDRANKRRRNARAARSEDLRQADNQARREEYAAQPWELRQTHNQARPSDRHAFILRLRALPPFISRMRTFASHRIAFVVVGTQLLRLFDFVQIAMAISSSCTLSRLPRSSHFCKLFRCN